MANTKEGVRKRTITKSRYEMIDYLSQMGEEVLVPKGHIIYELGDRSVQDAYVIIDGAVKVYEYTPSGNEYIFNKLDSSDIFLFQSALRNQLPHLSFVAMEETTLIQVPIEAIRNKLLQSHQFALCTIEYLSDELANARRLLRNSEDYSVRWKVCNILLEMANKFGEPYDNKLLITQKLSQQVMANMLRVSRITVARSIRELKESGMIEIVNGRYCIRDLNGLIKHMEDLENGIFDE